MTSAREEIIAAAHCESRVRQLEPATLRNRRVGDGLIVEFLRHNRQIADLDLEKRSTRLPGRKGTLLDTGSCGMAGAFGALESKYDLSLKVGADLVRKIEAQPAGSVVVASGTSCRHQIEHLTSIHPKHMAEVLAAAIG